MDGLPATTASRASAALSAERERGATRQRVLCAGASKSRRQSAEARARVSDGEQGPELTHTPSVPPLPRFSPRAHLPSPPRVSFPARSANREPEHTRFALS